MKRIHLYLPLAAGALLMSACASTPAPAPPSAPVAEPAPPAAGVPSPADFLGFEVGTARRLADWTEVTGYMEALAQASPRVLLDTLGETTLGRPFVMLTISSEANLERLDELHDIQMRLADPRRLESQAEADELIGRGRAIVLITASIHSTEVGASQVPMTIAHRLATSERELERHIRDNAIVLLVPSLNPDGVQLVVDWYEGTLGTPWEGASPPFLYHHYVGHDNNRDWYYFSQIETQLAIEHAHDAWHPQIVHDIHQMGSDGARLFIPPWIDPVEPNVDPLLIESINDVGTHMAWYVGLQGLEGVVVNATYDAWTPARAYQHYHAGARILTETASANMASPIVIPFEELDQGRNFHAQVASWNFPDPWPGGEWTLRDIVTYMEAGAFGLLEHAADNRAQWLRSFLEIGRNAIAGWDRWPEAWVIPAEQPNEPGVRELLRVLV
ncbi:MAG: M14 family zinc carboxypeptidase, partial [Longimicrobiales bacterium]